MNHVPPSPQLRIMRWLSAMGSVILVLAAIPPILSFYFDIDIRRIAREREVNTLLHDARDLMSTNPGTNIICTDVPLTDQQRVKIRSAQRKLDEAEKLDPSNYEVYMLKAGSYLLTRNFNEALTLAEKSVQLEEDSSKAHPKEKNGRPLTVLGGVYQEMGKVLKA